MNGTEGMELLSESELLDTILIHLVQEFIYTVGYHAIGIVLKLGLDRCN